MGMEVIIVSDAEKNASSAQNFTQVALLPIGIKYKENSINHPRDTRVEIVENWKNTGRDAIIAKTPTIYNKQGNTITFTVQANIYTKEGDNIVDFYTFWDDNQNIPLIPRNSDKTQNPFFYSP